MFLGNPKPMIKLHSLRKQNRVIILWTKDGLYLCDLLTREAAPYIDPEGMCPDVWDSCTEGVMLASYHVGLNRFSYYDVSGEGDWEHDIFGMHDNLLECVDQRSEDEPPLVPYSQTN